MQAWEPAPQHRSVTKGECWGLFLGKDALISDNGTHTLTDTAVDVIPPYLAWSEGDTECVVRVAWPLLGRPIEAVQDIAEFALNVVASSGQENSFAIYHAGKLATVHVVHFRPSRGAIIQKLQLLFMRRHHPRSAPFHMSHVVFRAADVGAKVVKRI